MTRKPTISGRDTYVLDPDEISQLDELSLTSVMRQAEADSQPEQERRADSTPTVSKDSTINELLSDPGSTTALQSGSLSQSAADETTAESVGADELIAPEIIFPEALDEDDS